MEGPLLKPAFSPPPLSFPLCRGGRSPAELKGSRLACSLLYSQGRPGRRGPASSAGARHPIYRPVPHGPRGGPQALCHDGQLQQLINYAEAINAASKHSSIAALLTLAPSLSLLLSLSLSQCAATPPSLLPPSQPPTPLVLIQCTKSQQPNIDCQLQEINRVNS